MVEYYQAFGKEKNPYHLSLIRFLRSIRRPEKWWNIIWYSKHKPNNICSLELYEVYQPNHLWTGINSCLYQKGCQAMVNKTSTLASSISKPKKINHPHYNIKKHNEQHQFDRLHVPHNIFENIHVSINTCWWCIQMQDIKGSWDQRLHLCCKEYIKSVVCLNTPRYWMWK